MKSLIKKYKQLSLPLKASLYFILCSFIQKAISLLTTPIFTRILTTDEYGIFSLYNSWVEILSIFITLKITEAIFNKTMVDTEKKERRIVLSTFQMLLTILSIIFVIIYSLFNNAICSITGLTQLLMISLIINVFFDATINLWMAYQRYEYKYIILVVVSIVISILNPVIGIIAVWNLKNKVFARIIGILVSIITVGIFIYIYNIKNFKISNFKKIFKYIICFNIPLLPHYLSQILLNHADRIIIDRVTGNSTQIAYYGLAYTIGMMVTIITQSINKAYTPTIYRLLKQKEIGKIIKINILLLYIVEFIILIVFLIAPELMLIIGGEKYMNATYSIYPIAASVLFIFIYTLYANIELYYGIRKYVTIGTCISAVANVILNYIYIFIYGYIAAAYTTLFCYICYGLFHVFVSKKILEEKEKIKVNFKISKIVVLSLLIVILSLITQIILPNMIIRYIILILVLTLIAINYKKVLKVLKVNN